MDTFVLKPAPVPKKLASKVKSDQKFLIVRDPLSGKPLKEDGEEKPQNSHWLRRVREGSAIVVGKKQRGGSRQSARADEKFEKPEKMAEKKGEEK